MVWIVACRIRSLSKSPILAAWVYSLAACTTDSSCFFMVAFAVNIKVNIDRDMVEGCVSVGER